MNTSVYNSRDHLINLAALIPTGPSFWDQLTAITRLPRSDFHELLTNAVRHGEHRELAVGLLSAFGRDDTREALTELLSGHLIGGEGDSEVIAAMWLADIKATAWSVWVDRAHPGSVYQTLRQNWGM